MIKQIGFTIFAWWEKAILKTELYFVHLLKPTLPRLRIIQNWTTGYQSGRTDRIYRLRKSFWQQADSPFKAKWTKDIFLWFYPNEEISRCTYLEGFFEPYQMSVLNQLLSPGIVFLDIGANSGIYSIFASKKAGQNGKVYSFEPSSREFKKLLKNIKTNNVTNIIPFQMGLSDLSGSANLNVASMPHTGHNTFKNFSYPSTIRALTEKTAIASLDDWIVKNDPPKIDIMKIDTEGAELKILQGAKKTLTQYRPLLLIEIMDQSLNQFGNTRQELWEYLSSLGYEFWSYESTPPVKIQAFPTAEYTDYIVTHKDSPWSQKMVHINKI